jgi:N6-L-threonylcarbamoyladenine synthase
MRVLGIETSCDETAAAVVDDARRVCASVIASQMQAHAGYGGVVPELAAREHLRAIDAVVDAALGEAGTDLADLDGVAVTVAPGLVPALLVGVSYAKGLALARGLPLVGVNHILAHVYGAFLDEPASLADPGLFPLLALAVSGGHTLLLLVAADGGTQVVGRTLDDAAGEALDKAARVLRLGYPGGPIIDRLARTGDANAFPFPRGLLPRPGHPVPAEHRFDFSFSGLKTALLYQVRERPPTERDLPDLAASYQAAVVDVLVQKSLAAARAFGAATLVVAGGVACNSRLRTELTAATAAAGCALRIAPPRYCTDNAAMIAGLGSCLLAQGRRDGPGLGVSARMPAQPEALPLPCRGAALP